jgi:hypothetical protein
MYGNSNGGSSHDTIACVSMQSSNLFAITFQLLGFLWNTTSKMASLDHFRKIVVGFVKGIQKVH